MTRIAGLLLLLALAGCGVGPVSLGDPAAWTAHPADGVSLKLGDDGGALRLDFAFTGGGYAIARREVALDLPDNYMFRFRVRGKAPTNHLEFKLVDGSGQNVWWKVHHDVVWPAQWRTFTIKKRQLGFAWGPLGGGQPRQVAAIEFAITAGSGGEGTVWIDGLELVPLPLVTGPPPAPVATASSAPAAHPAAAALDAEPATWWSAAADDAAPELRLNFGRPREYGGMTVVWVAGRHAADYVVESSEDGRAWEARLTVTGSDGGWDYLYLPESESQWLGLRLLRAAGEAPPAIAELVVRPPAWSATREIFFMNIAREAPRGMYPRGFWDEPTAWTVVGVDRDSREGLLGTTGALEAGPGEFSIEPFLWAGGRLITWNDVTATQSLADGYLPIPSVTWHGGNWRLTVTALGTGEAERSSLLASYRLKNQGALRDSATLYLALRPFQVNPPSQFLNLRGGTARVRSIERRGCDIAVDGRTRVRLLEEPARFGATTFAGGDVVADYLAAGRLPAAPAVDDGFGAASAAAAYPVMLAPGGEAAVAVLLPLHEAALPPDTSASHDLGSPAGSVDVGTVADPTFDAAAATRAAERTWRESLDRVTVAGPPAARDAIATLRAQLGYILVSRAGVRIQPGTRSYARSWIRDGALTGVALLRLGHAEAVRDFLTWYAPYQYASGKAPCVVDGRGADPVPEHDSTGEFIHLVTEYYRYTGDREMLDAMWPRVVAAVRYLESLLAERLTAEYRAADKREFYGILPPSISHEGYSAKPMHSYWDDFFALRGFKDAAYLAGVLVTCGEDSLVAERAGLVELRDRFARDLGASIAAAMARHGISYVPGCADLGDFDATSTTIALDPAAAQDIVPPGALERTFERYWEFFSGRAGGEPWEAFTPYEIRTIGAFVRLGWRERAQDLLQFFLRHRTPVGWRQWAEVVARDTTKARFIGDMPHTWVGSDYVRSFLDMFAYERRAGDDGLPALVLAAGVPAAWLADGGVSVVALPTPYGKLGYALRRDGDLAVMKIDGGLEPPPGGLLLAPPIAGLAATIDGAPARLDASGRVQVRRVPVEIIWQP
jgi:hypothetical protein